MKNNKKNSYENCFVFVYFQYEVLFSVHDEHDPAIMVVQKLIERYPKVDAKLFIGKHNHGRTEAY